MRGARFGRIRYPASNCLSPQCGLGGLPLLWGKPNPLALAAVALGLAGATAVTVAGIVAF